jgi:hypothetical protein
MVFDRQKGAHAIPLGLVLATFAASIFLSAALLFAVQPMFTKMVLPTLGGSPSVWSVALVFFQAMLLLGYIYAHFVMRHLPVRFAIMLHVAVLIGASLALPLSMASGWGRPPAEGQALWLLGLFAASIGLPFFALSANAPLLQAWFARTDHPAARDPYFLYAASNVGSFVALVSYPFVLEPFTRLGEQQWAWSLGFYVLAALVAICGLLLLRSRQPATVTEESISGEAIPPDWQQAATWLVLAAIPSGLLIAVTSHLSTDVAASPFLWVGPLALYLATFVIVFQTKPVIPHIWAVRLQPIFILLLVSVLALNVLNNILLTMAADVLGFFVSALVCHGELARRRPAPRYLTAFYMWMAAGGMIGGIAAALIAPRIFSSVAEYPLLIVVAVLCRPGLALPRTREDYLWWGGVAALALIVVMYGRFYGYDLAETEFKFAVSALLLIAILFWNDPLKFAALISLAFLVGRLYQPGEGTRDFVRSFFGVVKVSETPDGQFRTMQHGTTEHGAQRIRDEHGVAISGRPEPLTYYHSQSPMAEAIASVRARKNRPIRMAVVGLGTGSLACYFQPGDFLHFYEIDPAVVRIATDPARFTYLSNCAPEASIIVGDARLTIADADRGPYDLIIVDAFSSDAIPVHLLTREAMGIYLERLAPGGLILLHVSNRHMELASVAAGIAGAHDLITWVNQGAKGEDEPNYKFSSTVAAVAREEEDFGALADSEDWQLEEPDEDQWVWTDDYSNVIGAMIRQYKR